MLTVMSTGALGLAVIDPTAAVGKGASCRLLILCLRLILRMLARCARRLDDSPPVAADDALSLH